MSNRNATIKINVRGLILKHSRRDFLKTSSASIACGTLLSSGKLHAQTLHLPLALQLYSVRELLPTDYAGTLKQLGDIEGLPKTAGFNGIAAL